MDRERRLDQARRAGRRHRVADHRLDAAEPARAPSLGGAEELRERAELDLVAGRRRGAVRLDEPDAARIAVQPRATRARVAASWPSARGRIALDSRPSLDTPVPRITA